MVVANTDRETFGMSYTDDGEPFDQIQIPCVMISSDVCEKLESCRSRFPLSLRAPVVRVCLCTCVREARGLPIEVPRFPSARQSPRRLCVVRFV